MKSLTTPAAVVLLCSLSAIASAQPEPETSMPSLSPVTWERLLHAEDEPHNWLMYSGTLDSQRFSRLKQVNKENVSELELLSNDQLIVPVVLLPSITGLVLVRVIMPNRSPLLITPVPLPP